MLAGRLGPAVVRAATARVPDEWLADEEGFGSPDDVRAAYTAVLVDRLARPDAWLPGLEAARAAV